MSSCSMQGPLFGDLGLDVGRGCRLSSHISVMVGLIPIEQQLLQSSSCTGQYTTQASQRR
jgi:hypothetical protein